MDKKDRVFDSPINRPSGFQFDEKVANVFDDMLQQSVPFYSEIQRMTAELAKNFIQGGSRAYDLGCSTGTTLALLSQAIPDPTVRFVGYDDSDPMLEKCRQKLVAVGCSDRCDLMKYDLNEEIPIENASVVVINYTLQFVRPLHRDRLIRTIYNGLRERGCLIISEKILAEQSLLNSLYIDLYYELKKRNGYSEREIVQKREALENVLIPYKINENLELLQRNGFRSQDVFFRWYNFASFIAIKL